MSLKAKKVDYIFEEPFTYDCWLAFFLFRCEFQKKNRAKLKKLFNLNSRLRWGAQYPRYT